MDMIARTLVIPLTAALLAAQDPDPVATARLLETQGKLQEAEQVLRDALAQPSNRADGSVAVAYARILAKQGRAVELLRSGDGTARAQADPLDRLIAILDTGSTQNDAVHDAWRQIAEVGALAVPKLVRSLPELGPFGVNNVIQLVCLYPSPEVAEALRSLLESKAGPGVGDAIARGISGELERDPMIAEVLAQHATNEKQAYAAYCALGREPGDQRLRQRTAALVLQNGEARLFLKELPTDEPWASDLITAAMGQANATIAFRSTALRIWIEHIAESQAAALERLRSVEDVEEQRDVALLAYGKHPDWTEIGRMAAEGFLAAPVEYKQGSRAGSVLGPLLLEAAREASDAWDGGQARAIVTALWNIRDGTWLDVAVRVARWVAVDNELQVYLYEWGRGDPAVIALADLRHARMSSHAVRWAEASASHAQPESIRSLTDVLPYLPLDVTQKVYAAVQPALSPGSEPDVREAIGTLLRRLTALSAEHGWGHLPGMSSGATIAQHTAWTLGLVRATNARELAPLLWSIAKGDAPDSVQHSAARIALHLDPASAVEASRIWLTTPSKATFWELIPKELLAAPETAELAIEAIRGNRTSPECAALLVNLPDQVRADLAVEILAEQDQPWTRSVRIEAIQQIADAGLSAQLPPELVSDPSSAVRQALVDALAQVRDASAAGPLLQLLLDQDPKVRTTARDALDRLEDFVDRKARWDAKTDTGR